MVQTGDIIKCKKGYMDMFIKDIRYKVIRISETRGAICVDYSSGEYSIGESWYFNLNDIHNSENVWQYFETKMDRVKRLAKEFIR